MDTPSASSRPNIVMVIVHDLGQHLGCYGAGLETPNLDRLAQQGIRFDNYFCTAAQCSPSRGSILTGKYPHRNGLVGLAHIGWELNADEKTLPMFLNEAGYDTYLFGGQHESADSSRLGYANIPECGGNARETSQCFIEHLQQFAMADTPFYACLGFSEPHRPYGQPGYNNDLPDKVTLLPWLPDRPGIREDIGGLNGLVYEVDRCVGQVIAAIDAAGLKENTLLIFTTDHGTAMPRAKGTCYDSGGKTALLMHWPHHFEDGRVHGELLSNVDLMPTLCEIAQADSPEGIDGRSFLSLLEGKPYTERNDLYLEMTYHDRYNPMRAIRTRRHKYIRNFGERPLVYLPKDIYEGCAGKEMREEYYGARRPAEELYDLESDPLEKTNLADDAEYRAHLEQLRWRVQTWMEETGDLLLQGDWPPTELQERRSREDPTPN